MSAVSYGEQRPDLPFVAERIHLYLGIVRILDQLPDHMVLRIYAVDDTRLLVAVGGLDDRFLLGHNTGRAEQQNIDARFYTTKALRLWRAIEDVVRFVIPRTASGAPWFHHVVWMQTEPWWRKSESQPVGVIVTRGGEVQ